MGGEVLRPTLTWINTIVLQSSVSVCLLTSVSPNMLCDLTVELLLNVSYCVTAHKLVWLSLDMHQTFFNCCLIPDSPHTLYKWALCTLFQLKFMILVRVIDIMILYPCPWYLVTCHHPRLPMWCSSWNKPRKYFSKQCLLTEWNPTQHKSSIVKQIQVWLHNMHGGLFICLYAAASGCGQ